ncbi:MAG: hypothetical protein FGM52_05995 [Mycobacterium sp.]|nr:hypothetical protein [Mycobacterium sp.]
MTRFGVLAFSVLALVALAPATPAHADAAPPAVGSGCPADLTGVMTLLPDRTTYAVCGQAGVAYTWTVVQTPFAPNDRWLSYGPAITLHGQGMRNPNLSAGRWTAAPRTVEATCRAVQTAVVEAGVLAAPQVFEGGRGSALTLELPATAFYVELAGECLWSKL